MLPFHQFYGHIYTRTLGNRSNFIGRIEELGAGCEQTVIHYAEGRGIRDDYGNN